jgi:hypothetical protein
MKTLSNVSLGADSVETQTLFALAKKRMAGFVGTTLFRGHHYPRERSPCELLSFLHRAFHRLNALRVPISDSGSQPRDIQDDCSAVGRLADPTQRLADRLLLRHRDLSQDALAVFEWAAQPDCDEGFLRFVVKPAGIRNLRTHALTAADRDSVIRLHDVVFSSLSSLDWWTPSGRAYLDDKLEAFLDAASVADDLSLWAAAVAFRSGWNPSFRQVTSALFSCSPF